MILLPSKNNQDFIQNKRYSPQMLNSKTDVYNIYSTEIMSKAIIFLFFVLNVDGQCIIYLQHESYVKIQN